MAQKSNEKKNIKVVLNGSGGIDTRATHGKTPCMTDIVNFKILPDGSLKKRAGYRRLFATLENIRAVWSGNINGEFLIYCLAGGNLYSADPSSGELRSLGSINTWEGKAEFFYFLDRLYLADGVSIYEITPMMPILTSGYVPLLGKDWQTGYPGQINEKLNVLNARARITYKATAESVPYLSPMYPVKTINAIYKNGELLSSADYSYNPNTNLILVKGIADGDRFEANLTFESNTMEQLQSDILSCVSASVFGGINTSRLFLWNGRIKNTIYTSTYVPKASIEESIKRYPNSSPLYFTKDEHFAIGDGRYNVSAIARHYDRLLIFTEGEAWMADSASCSTDEFPVMTINSNIGCTAPEGALCANNTPITLSKNGIYRWTSDTDELNDCNAFCISEPISPLLSKDVFKNGILHFDRESNELWVHEGAESDVVWIYNFTYKRWIRYSGISAAHIFDVNGRVGFSDAHSIYVFDDSLSTDSNDRLYGNINASFSSGIVDFEDSDYKRIKTLTYRGDLNIPDGNIILSTDRGETIALALSGVAKHNVAKKRVSSHRLKSFSISLNENSQNEQTFHLFEIELK